MPFFGKIGTPNNKLLPLAFGTLIYWRNPGCATVNIAARKPYKRTERVWHADCISHTTLIYTYILKQVIDIFDSPPPTRILTPSLNYSRHQHCLERASLLNTPAKLLFIWLKVYSLFYNSNFILKLFS